MKPESHSAPAGHVFNSVKEIEASVKVRMEKAVTDLQHAMATIRTGRASVSLLDHIRVDYYGTPTPLNQIGNLHVPDPTLITVQPWDTSQIAPIEARVTEVTAERAELDNAPALFAQKRRAIISEIEAAESGRRVAADAHSRSP